MNILRPNSKTIEELEKENRTLKRQINLLEQEMEIRKIRYESKIADLRHLLFIASAFIVILALVFNIWR